MMCAHVGVHVCVCVNACGDQKRVSDPPEDGVTGTVSHLIWALGTHLGPLEEDQALFFVF